MIFALPWTASVMTPACDPVNEQHVHLPRRRLRAHLVGEVEQLVRLVAHRADDDADVVAGAFRIHDPARDAFDALGVSE